MPAAFKKAIMVLCVVGLSACVSEEQKKKADGYYQEGVAVVSKDEQSAFVSFQKSLQTNPKHRDSHYYVAYIYAKQKKLAAAEEEIREVLSIDPDYPEAYTFLGQILEAQGKWDEAIKAYRKAVEFPLYATPDVAYYNLGLALEHEADMTGAIQAFENALRVSPPNVPKAMIELEIGRANFKLGEDGKAREALARAIALNQDKNAALTVEAKQLMERLKR